MLVSIKVIIEVALKEDNMKHINKGLILILILAAVFLFTGCKSIRLKTFKDSDEPNIQVDDNKNKDIDLSEKDDVVDPKDHEEPIEETSTTDDTPTPTVIQPIENTELLIYVVNSSGDLVTVPALVPANEPITPRLIVDTVVDAMADQSLIIGIENVSTQDDAVIVSFYTDQPPLTNVGSGLEDAILHAIAQSLTHNLEDYHKVIYRVEGGPYVSGHIELELDEVYFEDNP